ncbi:hypothetical protein [Natrarchaeobaculum aegyptiacum]|uniref:hypothetical protein n=1 Tax=Natrarchaeobaculum aegyptiacum TaxID=745377 RepID=UPI0013747D22|nr:hypothetical protein [Natrarchaeobaculum aegyptiacum]
MAPPLLALKALSNALGPLLSMLAGVLLLGGLAMMATGAGAIDPVGIAEDMIRSLIGF